MVRVIKLSTTCVFQSKIRRSHFYWGSIQNGLSSHSVILFITIMILRNCKRLLKSAMEDTTLRNNERAKQVIMNERSERSYFFCIIFSLLLLSFHKRTFNEGLKKLQKKIPLNLSEIDL